MGSQAKSNGSDESQLHLRLLEMKLTSSGFISATPYSQFRQINKIESDHAEMPP